MLLKALDGLFLISSATRRLLRILLKIIKQERVISLGVHPILGYAIAITQFLDGAVFSDVGFANAADAIVCLVRISLITRLVILGCQSFFLNH